MTLSDTMLVIVIRRRYYEHVPYIANILNGMQPPKMSQVCVSTDFTSVCFTHFANSTSKALEDRLRMMFRDIQEVSGCTTHSSEFVSLTL